MWVEIALVIVLILINAALSGSEMALVTLRESQVNRLAAESERGRRLAALTADPNRFLSTIQIGITLAGFLASATAAVSLAEPLVAPLGVLGSAAEPVAVVIVTVILSYLTLVLGELAPKRIAMQKAPQWALLAAGPLAVVAGLARPLVWLLARSTEGIVRLIGLDPHAVRDEVSEEEIRDLISTSGTIPAAQRSILQGALELDERRLWQVLVPRADVVFVDAQHSAASARDALIEAGLSRAPVMGTSEDDVLGFVHLRQLVAGTGLVHEYVRPALVLPDSAGVLQALARMQRSRGQFALVVDEFGSIAGIVTLEDLLEEIVGEIYDEFDRDTASVIHRPGGEIELAGSFPAHDLTDLGIELPAGRHATVAGILLEAFGEIPPVGATATVGSYQMSVLDVTHRAILRIKITQRAAVPTAPPGGTLNPGPPASAPEVSAPAPPPAERSGA
jgi:putative hemolysin